MSDSEIHVLTEGPQQFQLKELLGTGSYGRIYHVTLPDNKDLSIKVVNSSDKLGVTNLREIDIMSKFHHPNIMKSHGITEILDDKTKKPAVSILMDLGEATLIDYVEFHGPTHELVNKLLHDVGKGISFIHGNNILHLDIKTNNIMVVVDNGVISCKIIDFGNSVYSNGYGNCLYDKNLTTITYRAPELFISPIIYTRAADIWSYGLVILYTVLKHVALFEDYRKTQTIIYELFSEDVKRETLTKLMTEHDVGDPLKDLYINLLEKMLVINPFNRIILESVLTDPVFTIPSLSEHKVGIIYEPTVEPILVHNVIQYRGFDYMMRSCLSLDDSTETMFLATDLYQRIVHSIEIDKEDEFNDVLSSKWVSFSCISLTCLWIAHKMIESTYLSVEDIVVMGNNSFDTDTILLIERNIIEIFGGILYRRNLYTTSKCNHKLVVAFNYLINSFTYPIHDLDKWENIVTPECGDNCREPAIINFKILYELTDYYKKSIGVIPLVQLPLDHSDSRDQNIVHDDNSVDYIQHIYTQDRNKYSG